MDKGMGAAFAKREAEIKAESALRDEKREVARMAFMEAMRSGLFDQGTVLHWLHDAGAKYPEADSEVKTSDELEVDDKPLYSATDDGVWVMCWAWVALPGSDDDEEEEEGEE